MVDSLLQSALQGMNRSMQNASAHVKEISESFRPGSASDPASAIVNLKRDQFHYNANAKVVQVTRDMDKAVLDILA